MDRLSNEILSEIFLWCIPISRSHTAITLSPNDAPLVLLLVCKSWKQEAESNPLLWTGIVLRIPRRPGSLITPPTSSPEYTPYRKAWAEWWHRVRDVSRGLRSWVNRSACLPLDLYVDNKGREPVPTTPEQAANNKTILVCLYRTILTEEYRWRSIYASVDYESILWGFLFNREWEDAPSGRYPLLQDITLDVEMSSEFNSEGSRCPYIDSGCSAVAVSAPFLHSLNTGSTPVSIPDFATILPFWHNITTLGFIEAGPEEVLCIFRACPLLQKCKLISPDRELDDEVDVVVVHRQPIVMFHLRDAFFQDYTPFQMNQISARMKAPYLYHLGLANTVCDHAPWRRCTSEICEIILECAGSLRSLGLDHFCMSKEHLLTYFTKATNLIKLRLDYSRVGDDDDDDDGDSDDWYASGMFDWEFLKAMTPQAKDGSDHEHKVLLPNLIEFMCFTTDSEWGPTFEEEDILRFIMSRQPPFASTNCLSELLCAAFLCKTFGGQEEPEDMWEEVDLAESLRAEGVDVRGLDAKGVFLRVAQRSGDDI